MPSVRERIVATMVQALNAPAGKPLPTVRQRPRPIAEEHQDGQSGIDSLLLYSIKETANRESANVVQRECSVRIEIPVAGTPPLDSATDPLYLFIVNTLYSDASMKALCFENGQQKVFWLEEVGLLWETISSYEDVSVCVLELKFVFATTTDPSVRV